MTEHRRMTTSAESTPEGATELGNQGQSSFTVDLVTVAANIDEVSGGQGLMIKSVIIKEHPRFPIVRINQAADGSQGEEHRSLTITGDNDINKFDEMIHGFLSALAAALASCINEGRVGTAEDQSSTGVDTPDEP